MKPEAAIFDLDGLMLDTERPFIQRLREKALEYGWDIPFELLIQTIGINYRATEDFLRDALGADFPYLEIRDIVVAAEKLDFETHGIKQRPGLVPLLDALAEKKIPIALATSTDRERALWKLQYGGIAAYFNTTVCGDEVKHGKPAPDIFLQAAKKLDMPPERCAGFEDSPAGLRALASAGIRSIFVKDLVEPDSEVLATVWKRCNDLGEAIPLF